MKFYSAGDKGKAICDACKKIVTTTFAYRDVPFNDRPGVVKDILAAQCDECGSVIAIPPQSTPAIKAARETATKSIEVILPAPYIESLDLAAFRIDSKATTEFRKRLLAFYIHKQASLSGPAKSLARVMRRPPRNLKNIGADVPRKRLSFKVAPRLNNDIEKIMKASSLNRTEVIRGLVIQINHDINRPNKPKFLAELRRLAAVAS